MVTTAGTLSKAADARGVSPWRRRGATNLAASFALIVLAGACSPRAAERPPADPFAVPPGTIPRYEIVAAARTDSGGVKRSRARITVPADLTRAELEANLRHAAHALYTVRPVDALTVLAYRAGTDTRGDFTAGKAELAPGGDTAKAKPATPLHHLTLRITVKDDYFAARGVTAPP